MSPSILNDTAQWALLLFSLALNAGLIYTYEDLKRRVPQRSAFLSDQGLPAGTEAPSLNATDHRTAAPLDLRSMRGGRVVLLFMSALCPDCERLLPRLNRLSQQSPSLPIIVIVAPGVGIDYATRLASRCGLVLDARLELFTAYAVRNTPYMYVVGEDGTVVRSAIPNDLIDLEDVLAGRGTVGRVGPAETTGSPSTQTVVRNS